MNDEYKCVLYVQLWKWIDNNDGSDVFNDKKKWNARVLLPYMHKCFQVLLHICVSGEKLSLIVMIICWGYWRVPRKYECKSRGIKKKNKNNARACVCAVSKHIMRRHKYFSFLKWSTFVAIRTMALYLSISIIWTSYSHIRTSWFNLKKLIHPSFVSFYEWTVSSAFAILIFMLKHKLIPLVLI